MTWKEFYAQLKENALQSVYLFAGPEEYLKREAVKALERALLPAGLEQLNETTLEGAQAAQIIDRIIARDDELKARRAKKSGS